MKKISRRSFLLAAAITSAAAALTACGGSASSSQAPAASSSTAASTAEVGNKGTGETLTIYTNSGSDGRGEWLTERVQGRFFPLSLWMLVQVTPRTV